MSEDFVPDVAVARKPMCAAAPRGDGRIELALFHRAQALRTQPLFFFLKKRRTQPYQQCRALTWISLLSPLPRAKQQTPRRKPRKQNGVPLGLGPKILKVDTVFFYKRTQTE